LVAINRSEKGKETTTAAGNLLTAPGLAFLSVVFVLAAWHSQTAILLLAGLFLSTAGLARLWNRLSLAGVRAERHLKGTRFFPGEPIECTLRILNRKPLPLPWVQIEDDLPAGFDLVGPTGRTRADAIQRSAALLWYRGISWKLDLIGRRRGYYPIGPLKLTSGDLLGLYSRTRLEERPGHIIVYPEIFPVNTRFIPSLHPMGEFQAARRLFRDPTHTIGVREYLRSDSLKFIHWKATARRGDLQVKVLAATTAFKVALFLDVDSFKHDGVLAEADFELAISIAGSIAAALCERGSPVGLLANTRLADTGQPAVIAPGAGRERITAILETLAKLTDRSSGPAAAFLDAQMPHLHAGTTLVFILTRPPDALATLLAGLDAAGLKILLLLVGESEKQSMPPEVPWRRIRNADDLARESLT
jgi:uncharacterized protein (DUF58 family)